MLKRLLVVLVVLLVVVLLGLRWVGRGGLGHHEGPGEVTQAIRPASAVAATERSVEEAAGNLGIARPKQILFGDLHVHTTFSFDAFMLSLPFQQGEGSHPPADACDFARFCSALDFWSINDHAEGISPTNWRETVDSIRQCNDVAGDPANPDTVAFLGWEWTQVGNQPSDHYGHKNVVLAHTDDARIPTRPIAAGATVRRARIDIPAIPAGAALLYAGQPRLHDFIRFMTERMDLDLCPAGVPVRDLPTDCIEAADTPGELFAKLDDWGHDSIVIPHGTTWGFYTPPGSEWSKQLADHDPARETLFEIYSGHGNSEEYREWRALAYDEDGNASCPPPSDHYLPSCWQAGEIIRGRCLAEGESEGECDSRAAVARQHAADTGHPMHLSVPGAQAAEWLDSGQCRDCEVPAFNYRPGGAAQYVMALSEFDDAGDPKRFRFGFMGSSDNHFARPGTGYKEVHRLGFTESRGGLARSAALLGSALQAPAEEPVAHSKAIDTSELRGFALFELERQSSFFMTGGLIAAHSMGRDRGAVWDAMQRREVYGTSGPRILLWFDLMNPPGTRGRPVPMGSESEMNENPIFRVRAVGSFEQKPGCPDAAIEGLGAEEVSRICKDECYHPSDIRRTITRIEVVRVRPQSFPGEPIADLIEDPWRTFGCEPNPDGCTVVFEDPEYAAAGRDTLYYVRAVEPPTPTINAAGAGCSRDAQGNCVEPHLCDQADSECFGLAEPRAWSSPIFVDWDEAQVGMR